LERDYADLVDTYGSYVDDNEISPFETHYAFHIRSTLHQEYKHLSSEQKRDLEKADSVLKDNVVKMHAHLSEIYDFTSSKKPDDEWWWHLDRFLPKEEK